MPDISAVIFDLGRVLVDLDLERGLFGSLSDASSRSPEQFLKSLLQNEIFADFNSGRSAPEEFFERVSEKADISLSFDRFVELWCQPFSPMNGMEELVLEVSQRIEVGLLSDTDPIHWAFLLREYPWLDAIEKPTLSFETGFMKPAPECYLKAAQNSGKPVESCLFVDDLERNVDGALAVGMRATLFEGPKALRRELTELGVL